MDTRLRYPKGYQFFDNNGNPLALGNLYYYIAGTTTLQDTYSDSAGTIPNTNPVVLDGSGRLQTDIYLGSTADYKEVLTASSATVSPWPDDNIVRATSITVFTGDSGSGGTSGLVPAPAAGDALANKYLKADGTWTIPPGGGTATNLTVTEGATSVSIASSSGSGATIPAATSSAAGVLDSTRATKIDSLAAVATSGSYADLTSTPALGTAAALNVPASGNAISGQVVTGSDSRLADARTPSAHAASHASGGSDPVSIAASQVTGLSGTFAPLASPVFTGSPAAPTQSDGDNSTNLATTAYIDRLRGASSGIATLDGSGKLTAAQVPASLVGAVVYQGVWNASTNTPALAGGVGTKGAYYKVNTAGTTSIDGIASWNVGDSIIFDGTAWDKIDEITNEVISVAGLYGNIASSALKTALAIGAADVSGLAAVATSGSYTDLTSKPTLGTAAALNVPASGNASTSQVVYGTDTRLTDSRTPLAHAASHASGGSDAILISASQVSGLATVATSGSYTDLSSRPWIDPITDYNAAGVNTTTTGSITAGQTALTVASATGWSVGMGIAVHNAGTGGNTELITSVTAISGNVLTLAASAVSTVSGQTVYHDDTAAISAAIAAAMTTGKRILFRDSSGFYNITSSLQAINSLATSFIMDVNGATLVHRSATADVFTVSYAANPDSVGPKPICVIDNVRITQDQSITPTAGYALNFGSNILSGPPYSMVVGFRANCWQIDGLFGGVYVNNGQIRNNLSDFDMNNLTGTNTGLYLNSASPSGDTTYDNFRMNDGTTSTKTGVTVVKADTQTLRSLKTNGAGVIFANANKSDVYTLRFEDASIEGQNSVSYGVDFGTVGVYRVRMTGGNGLGSVSAFRNMNLNDNGTILMSDYSSNPTKLAMINGALLDLGVGGTVAYQAFNPINAGVLKLWMDPSSAANYTISSGSSISQLKDLSGNANHATQATSTKQFTVQTAAQNGLNTLRATAANSQFMSLGSVIDLTSTGYTILAVVRRGGPSGTNVAELFGNTTTDVSTIFEWYSDGTMYFAGNSGEYANMLSPITGSAYHQVTFGYGASSGSGFMYVDGAAETITKTALAGQVDKIGVLGVGDAGVYGNFEFGEFYVYQGILADAERIAAQNALKAKWGTP